MFFYSSNVIGVMLLLVVRVSLIPMMICPFWKYNSVTQLNPLMMMMVHAKPTPREELLSTVC